MYLLGKAKINAEGVGMCGWRFKWSAKAKNKQEAETYYAKVTLFEG